MTSLGAQIEATKNNNLNAIRLMLALAVILSHSYPLCFGGGEAGGELLYTRTHQQATFGILPALACDFSWLPVASPHE
jgi:hypothetical protein